MGASRFAICAISKFGCGIIARDGAVAELADAADLKSAGGDTVWVRPPPALQVAFWPHFRPIMPYIGAYDIEKNL